MSHMDEGPYGIHICQKCAELQTSDQHFNMEGQVKDHVVSLLLSV